MKFLIHLCSIFDKNILLNTSKIATKNGKQVVSGEHLPLAGSINTTDV